MGLLEPDKSLAFLGNVKNIFDTTDFVRSENHYNNNCENHCWKLKRIRPYHRSEGKNKILLHFHLLFN